ncbi:compound eye opsin BCRH2-like [Amphiura filiformis]|uniref:compound eye opsin BCRH2-like n=1 Tax=Amphiura filiformis TaxID=82378 RepID=UPI003B2175D8
MAITAWALAPVMQIMLAIFQFDNENGECTIQEESLTRKFQATIGVFTFLWEYFIPVSWMTCAFVAITLKLRKQGRKLMTAERTSVDHSTVEDNDTLNAPDTSTDTANAAKRLQRVNVTKTLFMVYIIYVICWSPNQIGFLQFNLGGSYDFQGAYHSFSVILAMCNTSINPFIYAMQYKQYRAALKSLLRCQCRSNVVNVIH